LRTGRSLTAGRAELGRLQLTGWSMVAGVHNASDDRRAVFEQLCSSYFYPVFAYLRLFGFDERIAYAHARGFFEQLLGNLQSEPPQGRFRQFLLAHLQTYAQNPQPPTLTLPGTPSLTSVGMRFSSDTRASEDIDATFEALFAREIMILALRRLRTEAVDNGRARLFDHLVDYITRDPSPEENRLLQAELGMSNLALTIARKRLRARYAELGNQELAETVINPEDLAAERSVVHTLLGRKE